MKKFLSSSFRYRLFAAFLVVSLIPLLICSAMLLQIFRLRMTGDAQREAEEHLDRVGLLLDESCQRFLQAAQSVQRDDVLKAAMLGAEEEEMVIYGRPPQITSGFLPIITHIFRPFHPMSTKSQRKTKKRRFVPCFFSLRSATIKSPGISG